MATITVDSLVVRMMLDATNFDTKRKAVVEDWLKTKESFQRSGREIGDSTKSMGEFVGGLRDEFLKLFAVVAGGQGLKEYFGGIIANNAAIGRLAPRIGATTEQLSKFMTMVRLAGGDDKAGAAGLKSFSQALTELATIPGSHPELIRYLNAFHINIRNANGTMKTASQLMPELQAAVSKMDKQVAGSWLAGMGFNDDIINLLLRSQEEFRKLDEEARKIGLTSKEDAKAAEEAEKAWNGLVLSIKKAGDAVVLEFGPPVTDALNNVTKLMSAMRTGENPKIEGSWTADSQKFLEDVRLQIEAFKELRRISEELWKGAPDKVKEMGASTNSTLDGLRKRWDDDMTHWSTSWGALWDSLPRKVDENKGAIAVAIKGAFDASFKAVMDQANEIWEKITGNKLFKTPGDAAGSVSGGAAGGGVGSAGGAAVASVPLNDAQIQERVKFAMSLGRDRQAAIAMVANEMRESGGDPSNRTGDGGNSRGSFQHDRQRRARFSQLNNGKVLENSTWQEQYQFADWEMRHTHPEADQAMNRPGTAGDKAAAFMDKFENPADKITQAARSRANAAKIEEIMRKQDKIDMVPDFKSYTPSMGQPLPPQASAGGKGVDVKVGQITINGVDTNNAAAIGKSVADQLKEQIASQQYNTGYA